MESIFSGRVGNEYAGKLTRIQKEEIQRVLKQKPSIYGLPKEFWDVLSLEIKEQFSFKLSFRAE